MRTEKIVEGKTELIVPSLSYNPGVPGNSPVFYNPRMEFARNVAVCCMKVIGKKYRICDALSATGVGGLRYANEVGNPVTFFDINPEAARLIKRNVKYVGINGVVKIGDSKNLIQKGSWDIVCLDPFASPVPFLDATAGHAEKYTVITATDTTVLCGVYPEKCKRVYGALPLRNELCHEVGLRILVGKVARDFIGHGKGVFPLLAHASDHFFRLVAKIEKGKKGVARSKRNLGWVLFCKCGSRKLVKRISMGKENCGCGRYYCWYGPLWAGRLMDTGFCRKAGKFAEAYGKREQDFFATVIEESKINFLPYSIHEMARGRKKEIKKTDDIVEGLRKKGYRACKSHLGKRPMVRTNAGLKLKKFIFY